MEALAAVSLASNVLQFVDFSLEVLSQGASLKRSADGSLKEHTELRAVVVDLEKLVEQLDGSDPELEPLIEKCRGIATELKDALHRALRRTGKSAWSSYRAALSAVWNQSKLDNIEKRLDSMRSEIGFRLQCDVRRAISGLSSQLLSTESHAERAANGIQELSNSQKLEFGDLAMSARSVADSILENVTSISTVVQGLNGKANQLHNICQQIQACVARPPGHSVAFSTPMPKDFLETLEFRGMNDREESIPAAHAQTFEWLLVDSNTDSEGDETSSCCYKERKNLRTELESQLRAISVDEQQIKNVSPSETGCREIAQSLQQFLRSRNGILWIHGKPGSAKSTFMKAMTRKASMLGRTKELLNEWLPDYELLIAKFFFFRAGSDMQKSHLGLIQSLLHQLLTQNEKFIDLAFSQWQQREAIARSLRLAGTDSPLWSIGELKAAFHNLLQRAKSFKIYLHIDGIDEMYGPPKDIARILCDIAANKIVKILVAGRRTPEFENAFGLDDALNFHLTTDLDILYYTVDHLFQKDMLDLLSTPQKFMAILTEILFAAEGVFLWVKIVVESLLEGACRFENYTQLYSRLMEYPKDLDELYWFLLTGIDLRYSESAAFWLLAVNRHQGHKLGQITTIQMDHAEKFDPDDVESLDKIYVDLMKLKYSGRTAPLEKRSTAVVRRIAAQCPHFFDFQPPQASERRIVFCHRTVLDFLVQDDVIRSLEDRLPSNKNPYQAVISAKLAEAMKMPRDITLNATKNSIFVKCLDEMTVRNYTILYRQLVSFCSRRPEMFNVAALIAGGYPCVQRTNDPRIEARQMADHLYFTPTTQGWLVETSWSKLDRVSQYQEPFLHLRRISATCYQDLLLKAKFRDISEDERTNILLSQFVVVALDQKLHKYRAEIPLPKQAYETLLKTLLPSRLVSIPVVWLRFLEFIRLLIACGSKSVGMFEAPGEVKHWLLLVETLLSLGADPNVLCRNIWEDPDKSLQSPISVFSRLLKHPKGLYVFQQFKYSIGEAIESQVSNIIDVLRKAGGEALVIPPRKSDDVGIQPLRDCRVQSSGAGGFAIKCARDKPDDILN